MEDGRLSYQPDTLGYQPSIPAVASGDKAVKLRALDLFCAAGGASMGLHRCGFEVVGVDINPQPHYPFEFIQADALTYNLEGYDLIWASPPCQAFTAMQHIHKNGNAHKDLVASVRNRLRHREHPWIIENVKGSPLKTFVMLCGTMFGLRIIKHRYFEVNFHVPLLMPPCDHSNVFDPWHGKGRTAKEMREAQGTPWIPIGGGASRKRQRSGDLNNAIPPAYAEFLGKHALSVLTS